MVAIDTNIAVRLLVNDDPAQTKKAVAIFTANQVFIPKTVILETEWVLRGVYLIKRDRLNAALRSLLSLERVVVEDEASVFSALDACDEGMDFADALHLASSQRATSFFTFDSSLRTRANKLSLQPQVARP